MGLGFPRAYVVFFIALFHGLFAESLPEGNGCNMYQGRWVYDESYPLYDSAKCPNVGKEFDCQKYGRSDKMYLKYRWQPDECQIPRFDGNIFLSKWRKKKIMFVGDSLSYNAWQSLFCMLHAAVPNARISSNATAGITDIVFEDYEVSVMIHMYPYLVDIVNEKIGRVLKLDSLQNSKVWRDIDLLIFNTWYWWFRTGTEQPFHYIQDGNQIYRDMNRTVAFSKALTTWAQWVNSSDVNPSKTTVVYQGVSPSHYRGDDWGQSPSTSCSGQTQPVMGSTYPAGPLPQEAIVKNVLSTISKPVHLLDITLLSQLRKDAHPASYNGDNHTDCGHWCIAGLPDTWNQLLYATLF